ncbi:hypothetical protein HMSSN139_17660 [Paenibacillus sp. HMSSN-139]|nr:hypothetical protein HMSSN139_17660 [Paenibacillus sp. HMSSN-139]
MRKLFKLLGNKRLFILLMGLILFIAVMGFTLGPRTNLSWPEKFVKDTVGFVQYVFYKPASYVAGLFEDISNLRALQEENEQLKIALAHYTRDKATYNWIEQENKRLKDELDFTEAQKRMYDYTWKIAQVISVNDDPVNRTIVVNLGARGRRQGGDGRFFRERVGRRDQPCQQLYVYRPSCHLDGCQGPELQRDRRYGAGEGKRRVRHDRNV